MQKKKLFILIIFIFILLCSTLSIIMWYIDNYNSNKILTNIKDTTKINTIDNTNNIELINPDNNPNSQYWNHINENLINVDIKELKENNSDIIGWINVKGSNVNYPFVQTNNNSYYLNHSINKKLNSVGCIFLDYRNNINELSKNNILYGHARKDKTMFGSLKSLLKKEWFNNKNIYRKRK